MRTSVWITLCLLGATVWADDADFGDTVTDDIKLTGNISGSGDGLIIGANGITIDLNGYTISSTDGTGVGINNEDGYHCITIKDGTIDGFSQGVLSDGGDDLEIEDLTVDGAFGSGDFTAAIHVLNADEVTIEGCDVSVETFFLGAHAIRLDSVSDATVKKCNVSGGFIGISFFSVTQQDDPTTGKVEECTVEDCFIGILMGNTDDAEVKECTVKDANPTIFGPGAPQGIRVGFDEIGVSGIKVEGNECTNAGVAILVFSGYGDSDIEVKDNECNDSNRGILAVLTVDSKFEGNTCNGNTLFGMAFNDCDDNKIEDNQCNENGLRGIVLVFGSDGNEIEDNECNDNALDGISLFLGANVNNEIEDNEATGNGVWDCFHNADSSPNTWEDNECDTSSGDDIG